MTLQWQGGWPCGIFLIEKKDSYTPYPGTHVHEQHQKKKVEKMPSSSPRAAKHHAPCHARGSLGAALHVRSAVDRMRGREQRGVLARARATEVGGDVAHVCFERVHLLRGHQVERGSRQDGAQRVRRAQQQRVPQVGAAGGEGEGKCDGRVECGATYVYRALQSREDQACDRHCRHRARSVMGRVVVSSQSSSSSSRLVIPPRRRRRRRGWG